MDAISIVDESVFTVKEYERVEFIKKFSKIYHWEKFQFKEVSRMFPTSYFVNINRDGIRVGYS